MTCNKDVGEGSLDGVSKEKLNTETIGDNSSPVYGTNRGILPNLRA